MQRIVLLLCSILLSQSVFAKNTYKIEVDARIMALEEQVLGNLDVSDKKNRLKVFKAYNITAEEAMNSGEHPTAIYLLDQATQQRVDVPMGDLYIRMLGMTVLKGNISLGKKILKQMEKKVDLKKAGVLVRADYYMFKVLVTKKLHNEVLSQKEAQVAMSNGQNGKAIIEHDIAVLFNRRKFKEVHQFFNPKKMQQATISDKILYDLSGVLSGGKKELVCQTDFEQFPGARNSSYSLKTCQILLKFKQKDNYKDHFEELSEILEKFPRKKFILTAVKRLKK
jgi:hypothetical protein